MPTHISMTGDLLDDENAIIDNDNNNNNNGKKATENQKEAAKQDESDEATTKTTTSPSNGDDNGTGSPTATEEEQIHNGGGDITSEEPSSTTKQKLDNGGDNKEPMKASSEDGDAETFNTTKKDEEGPGTGGGGVEESTTTTTTTPSNSVVASSIDSTPSSPTPTKTPATPQQQKEATSFFLSLAKGSSIPSTPNSRRGKRTVVTLDNSNTSTTNDDTAEIDYNDDIVINDDDDEVPLPLTTTTTTTTTGSRDGSRSNRSSRSNPSSSTTTPIMSTVATFTTNLQKQKSMIPKEATLQWQSLKIHGRNKERLLLQECLHRLQVDRQKQLVLIKGRPGVGKTTLVHEALQDSVQNKHGGLFVTGRFPPYLSRHVPYGVFQDMFDSRNLTSKVITLFQKSSSMKQQITQPPQTQPQQQDDNIDQQQQQNQRHPHDRKNFKDMREHIIKELGTELIEDLLRVFPGLESLLYARPKSNFRYDKDDDGNMIIVGGDVDIKIIPENNNNDNKNNNNNNDDTNTSSSSKKKKNNGIDDDEISEITIFTDDKGQRLQVDKNNRNKTTSIETLLYGHISNMAKNRFLFAFKTFVKILGQYLSPIVFVIDNIQWADTSSIELIENLLLDNTNKDLMIIGIYRSSSSAASGGGNNNIGSFDYDENDSKHSKEILKRIQDLIQHGGKNQQQQQQQQQQEGNGTTTSRNQNGQKVEKNNTNNETDTAASATTSTATTGNNNKTNTDGKSTTTTESSNNKNYFVTEIEIGNLDLDGIHHMLQDLMMMTSIADYRRTQQLAEICHSKTNGNAFHFVRFLSLLYDKQLLLYKTATAKWIWDVKGINQFSSTFLTNTPANNQSPLMAMLKQEILSLPEENQKALRYASFLGLIFQQRVLEKIWTQLYEKEGLLDLPGNENNIPIHDVLKSCEEYGFLKRISKASTSFCFVHNLLQEAAFELIPVNERPILKEEIAETLMEKLNEQEVDDILFVIANLYLGASKPIEDSTKLEWAEMNYRAAQKAATWSAFDAVSIFCGRGASFLPPFPWGDDYELCRNITSLMGEVESSLGRKDVMEQCCNLVLKCTDREIEDRYRAYNVLMDSWSNTGRCSDARMLCLGMLEENYGCKFPKGGACLAFRNVTDRMKLKPSLKSQSALDVKKLPTNQDSDLIQEMYLFDKLASFCWQSDDELLSLIVFKSVRWTLKYGVCNYSPAAFAMASLILAVNDGDLAGGAIYSKHALQLLSILKLPSIESRTVYLVHVHSLHWTEPAKAMLKPLMQAYEVGMKAGDIHHATLSIYYYIFMSFVSGRPLPSIEKDCRMYSMQMKSLKVKHALDMCLLTFQLVLNLMGHSKDAMVLTGEAMDEEKFKTAARGNEKLLGVLRIHRLMIHSIFGDYSSCATIATASVDTLKGSPLVIQQTFHRGLALLVLAQKTKQKAHSKEGKQLADRIKRWAEKGNKNVKQYEELLQAEIAHSHGRVDAAKRHYETSISLSSEGGFVGDAAIASERYGLFLLETAGDKPEATRLLKEASKRFREWGAYAKADALEAKHQDIFVTQKHPRAYTK